MDACELVARLRRGVIPGATTVGEFAMLVGDGAWPADADISEVTALGGKAGVARLPGDTTLALALPGGKGAVYLAIAGTFEPAAIGTALRGASSEPRVHGAVIRQIGFETSELDQG